MSIASEISRIQSNIADSLTAVANKGVTVPSGSNSDDLAGLIAQITGGATNYVTGTFTGTTYGALEVSIPYTGSGYPLALIIYPSVGVYKSGSDIYDLVKRYVIVVYSRVKSNTGEAPTYTDTTETNRGSYLAIYKNSTSDPTTIANNGNLNSTMFTTSNAGDSLSTAVRFKSSTVLSVFIANASYGFAQNIEYTYQVVYSS